MKITRPDIWKNPYQRCGYVNANVLIGSHVLPTDLDLFFGPLDGSELFIVMPDDTTMPRLLVHLQLFASGMDATRSGYGGKIGEGFTDITGILKKHRVTILKVTTC